MWDGEMMKCCGLAFSISAPPGQSHFLWSTRNGAADVAVCFSAQCSCFFFFLDKTADLSWLFFFLLRMIVTVGFRCQSGQLLLLYQNKLCVISLHLKYFHLPFCFLLRVIPLNPQHLTDVVPYLEKNSSCHNLPPWPECYQKKSPAEEQHSALSSLSLYLLKLLSCKNWPFCIWSGANDQEGSRSGSEE